MKPFHTLFLLLAIFLLLANPLPTNAAIVYSGDLVPTGNLIPDDWSDFTRVYIGYTDTSNPGQIEVNGGSSVLSGEAYLGYAPGTSGTLTVTGAESTWTNSRRLNVGHQGSGTLSITDGGTVSNRDSYIGYLSGSTGIVTVDGNGSTWTNSYNLYVGRSGSGTLSITGGGTVSNRDGYIYGPTGIVTVDGNGSTWTNNYDLYVGYGGNSTLNITNGGAVNVANTTNVYCSNGSTGFINFGDNGGTLTTKTLFASPTQLSGTGMINTNGIISDGYDLLFDSTHGTTQTLTIGGSGQEQNIAINLDMSDTIGNLGANNGSMTIDGIAVISEDGYIGYYSGSNGVVTVDGNESTWTNNDNLHVGYRGNGTLNITNGGTVNVANNTYVARYHGYDGAPSPTGSINFGNNGSTLTTRTLFASPTQLSGTGVINTNGIVGDYDLVFDSTHGTIQTLAIGGSGQEQNITINLDMSDTVGDLGVNDGSMTIDGIVVNSQSGYIGFHHDSTGVVTIDGNESTWTNSSNLYVGFNGNGTLNITNGGAVNSLTGTIAFVSGLIGAATGAVTVDGNGSTWTNNGSLIVGRSNTYSSSERGGDGTLNITNGGTVSNTNSHIGYSHDSTGVVTVDGDGSTWTNSDSLIVGGGDLYRYNNRGGGGTLNITNGGAVSNTNSHIGYSYKSTGAVTVDGTGSTWTNSGNLYVGNEGSGTLTITNDGLVSVAGTLIIEYNTTSNGLVNISDSGMLALLGNADDSLAAFFDLIEGTDAIQWWDPEASGWNSLSSAIMGEDYTLEYFESGELAGYTLLTVTAIEPGAGDVNCDGKVDGSDVTILANHWQAGVDGIETANWAMGDLNKDGKVDGSDVTILANNWQSGVNASANAVPEPTTLVSLLMLLGAGLTLTTRKR